MSSLESRTGRPRIAVLTFVSGEHGYLLNHTDGLSLSTWPPDVHVAVSVRDRELTRGRVPIGSDRWTTVVPRLPVPPGRPAFLQAVDLAARHAMEEGAEVLVYLAVQAIPAPRLLQVLAEAAVSSSPSTPTLWCSTVATLPPPPAPAQYPVGAGLGVLATDRPEPRPAAAPDVVDSPLSVAFATTPDDWAELSALIPVSHPDGGTASDLETIATAASVRTCEVPGATAYLQHPSGSRWSFRGSRRPPVLRGGEVESVAAGVGRTEAAAVG